MNAVLYFTLCMIVVAQAFLVRGAIGMMKDVADQSLEVAKKNLATADEALAIAKKSADSADFANQTTRGVALVLRELEATNTKRLPRKDAN